MKLHITTLNYNVTLKKVEETNSNTVIAGRGGVLVVPHQVSCLSPPVCKVLPKSVRGIVLEHTRKEQESVSISVV
jgi:hypothetical protein